MESQGVKFGNGLENMDLGLLKNASEEIQYFRQEFPQAASAFSELNGEETRANVYASANRITGNMQLSNMMTNAENVKQTYERDVLRGYHPSGTSSNHIVTHESGHILEKALLDKTYANDPSGRQKAFRKRTEANKIVIRAYKEVGKTLEGKNMGISSMIGQISRYASKNSSETIAEAVADFRANGAKAKPLSRAIWNELKKELG